MKKILYSGIMFAVLLFSGSVFAQTITLTAPTSNKTFTEGDEFSVNRVHSRWDMDQLRDIPFDVGYYNPGVKSGTWTATNNSTGSSFIPLWNNDSINNYDTYITGMMPYGGLNPIPASSYTHMSIKMSMDQSDRSNFFVFWTKSTTVAATDASYSQNGYIGFKDAEHTKLNNTKYNPTGYMVHDIDLTNGDQYRDQLTSSFFDTGVSGGTAWSDYIYGLQVQPSSAGTAGMVINIDWIRLYNAASSETLSFTWSTSGAIGSDYYVQLYADTDSSGNDGTLVKSGLSNDNSYSMYVSMLPPGEYYFYLRLMKRGDSSLDHIAYSGYSAKVTILNKPQTDIMSPSHTSGVDYAEYELGKGWNMNDSGDFKYYANTGTLTFNNGILSTTADAPVAPDTESDIRFDMNQRKLNEYNRIDCSRYRYCTFRMNVDNPNLYSNIQNMREAGWMARLLWGKSNTLTTDGSYSTELFLYEGWHSYSVDLEDSTLLEDSSGIENLAAQIGWLATGTAYHFQFDPLEVWYETPVHIDYVKLCSENKPTYGTYTIKWKTTDPDSSTVSSSIYYGTKDAYGNFSPWGTVADVSGHSTGDNSYDWDTSGVAAGEYYIAIKTDDGSGAITNVSRVPVVIESTTDLREMPYVWNFQWGWPGAEPVSGDYDGDGLFDFAVFDQNSGAWYIINAYSEILVWGIPWGWPGAQPVSGDYDGDGVYDLAIYDTSTGDWYVYDYYDATVLRWAHNWGFPDSEPVSGDFDGDGEWDHAVFYTGAWYIWITSTGDTALFADDWGWVGANPVSGDFNGDGKWDMGIYDTNTGYWYIKDMYGNLIAWALQWGWPGADTVSGDYDGDGKYDPTVFDNNGGNWYSISSDGTDVITWAIQWGWSGAVPVPGDYIGDDHDDLAVFDSNTGYWYVWPN